MILPRPRDHPAAPDPSPDRATDGSIRFLTRRALAARMALLQSFTSSTLTEPHFPSSMPSVRPVPSRRAARLLGRFGAGMGLPLLLGWYLFPAERGILALRPGIPDRPGAVLAADFNLDGKVDLLQANFQSSDVSFFQEDPAGNYVERTPSPFLTAAGPTFLASADLNADNRPDAVVVNRIARTVTVLLSEALLTFDTQPSIVAARGAQSVAVADYNRDGRPDLAITGEVDDTISIYVGHGDGT